MMVPIFSSQTFFSAAKENLKVACGRSNRETSCMSSAGNRLAHVFYATTAFGIGAIFRVSEGIHELRNRQIKPFLPNIPKIRTLSLEQVHKIVLTNHHILVGILALEKISDIGFHGTRKEGLEGILSSRRLGRDENDNFYVAGVSIKMDPITYLADLSTAVEKALCYAHEEGGIFSISTVGGEKIFKKIWTSSDSRWLQRSTHKFSSTKKSEAKFLDLLWRATSDMSKSGAFKEDIDRIPTSLISSVDEMFIKDQTDPDQYKKKVLCVLKDTESIYPLSKISEIHKESNEATQANDKIFQIFSFVSRLRTQEVLFKTFSNKLQHPWEIYYNKGVELMNNINQVTTVSRSSRKHWPTVGYNSEYMIKPFFDFPN